MKCRVLDVNMCDDVLLVCYVADRFQSLLQLARYRRVAVAGSRCQQVSVNMDQPAILGLCKTGNPFPNIRTSTRMKTRSSLAVFADENAVNWLGAQCIYDDLFIYFITHETNS